MSQATASWLALTAKSPGFVVDVSSCALDKGFFDLTCRLLSRQDSKQRVDMIEGISHITFIVRDLNRMASFLKDVFDAKEVYSSGDKTLSQSREMFFLINDLWIAIMEGEPLKEPTYNHVAFKISEPEFERYETLVLATGIDIKPRRPRVLGEGRSLCFYDFDNHLFELHTGTLTERLLSYRNLTPLALP